MTKKNANRTIAIVYDFDKTLAPGNMQEHSFLPENDIGKDKFWKAVKDMAEKHRMDQILSYMQLLIKFPGNKRLKIKRRDFEKHGSLIKLFKGLESTPKHRSWFKRINSYGKERDIKVNIEHYIISSGLEEMIDGTRIKKYFTRIFASTYKYITEGDDLIAEWPALAVNFTTKTQYMFRINKGITNSWDNTEINKHMLDSDRPIPFSNMIYIGDGDTDIPCMKMTRLHGGYSLAVYNPNSKNKTSEVNACLKLVREKRTDFVAAADYRPGTELDIIVRKLVRKIAVEMDIKDLKPSQ